MYMTDDQTPSNHNTCLDLNHQTPHLNRDILIPKSFAISTLLGQHGESEFRKITEDH